MKINRFTTGILELALVFGVVLFLIQPSTRATEPDEKAWAYVPALLRPFWHGKSIEGESVLFIRQTADAPARASVLFPIESIIAVRNSAGDITYEEGRDYEWTAGSRDIVIPAGSRIVTKQPQDLRRPAGSQKYMLTHRDGNGEILFGAKLEYHDMQTCITYTHEPDEWKGDLPAFDAAALPRTIGKLGNRQPVSIAVIGDSISAGNNASGFSGGPPWQPAFPGLIERHLAAVYEAPVQVHNLAVDGRDTQWALGEITAVTKVKPDLVIYAFGMNDSAGRSTEDFQANAKAFIEKVRDELPETEFILAASMLGNRDWITLKHELFPEYRDAFRELCEPGIALADLTAVWTEFLERKQDWDLTGNGVNHPNDFGHRVYAQVISALLIDLKKQP
ncbi:MAG: SGNH/GDSL hydrolase family protein [Planctomycetota bacterium]|nr:SGNH/GDSL hydrolase family protein [Planctomycetota bacterium]MDA1212389.1 SGNH/GDSL hydrolase family protein [Planctomycetota bacterium]